MKFNDREIAIIGTKPGEIEGSLLYLRPQNNDWSTWYSAPSYKERKFKLVSNFLFYYRVEETEPLGVLVLENAVIKHEKSFNGVVFSFSIEFQDEQGKYMFSCRCQDDANRWVSKLNAASYEYWRSQLIILQTKISMRTGKQTQTFSGNQAVAECLEWSKKKIVPYKSSFRSHLDKGNSSFRSHLEQDSSGMSNCTNNLEKKVKNIQINKPNEPPVEDLIKF